MASLPRVKNGYGTETSVFSPSLIGSTEKPAPRLPRDPPGSITDKEYMAMSGLMHPSRRDKHSQVYYPSTIQKLHPPTGDLTTKETPMELLQHPSLHKTKGQKTEVPFSVADPKYTAYLLNERKCTDEARRKNQLKSTQCQW